jgi:integrase
VLRVDAVWLPVGLRWLPLPLLRLRVLEALQDIPWPRPGELAKATLPELVEWRHTHPDGPRITGRSVNKQFGGVQAIINWARENGMISDHLWSDPFSKMRVEEDDPEGGPFDPDELRTLFASRVFTAGECPKAGQGDVAFWLPVLALFTGARRGELTMLQAADVSKDDTTGQWVVAIYNDRDTGKKLKTKGSARTIPLHPELVRLGFLDFVEATGRDHRPEVATIGFGRMRIALQHEAGVVG